MVYDLVRSKASTLNHVDSINILSNIINEGEINLTKEQCQELFYLLIKISSNGLGIIKNS